MNLYGITTPHVAADYLLCCNVETKNFYSLAIQVNKYWIITTTQKTGLNWLWLLYSNYLLAKPDQKFSD